MRARQRRLWTHSLTFGAIALILVVVAVSGFRFLVKMVPSYRDDIEQQASATLGQRLTIRELDLSWRRFRPSLDLMEVTVYALDDRTPALKLRELNLGIDWLALLIGRVQLAEMRLAGLALTVERAEDGSLKVSGISSDEPLTADDLARITRIIDSAERVVVADSQVLWLDYTDPNTFHRIDDIDLAISSRGSWHRLTASAVLPAGLGGQVQLKAKARGNLAEFDALKVESELQLQEMNLGQWLRPWLRKGIQLQGNETELQLQSTWQGRRLVSAAGELRTGSLQLRSGGSSRAFMDDVQTEFKVDSTEQGWQLSLERLSLEAASRQPTMTTGKLKLQAASGDQPRSLAGSLNQLRLDEIGDWLALFDLKDQDWLASLQPVGYVQDLGFHYSEGLPADETRPAVPPRYGLQCRFEGLGVSPAQARPGATGLGGRLKLDESGGELMLLVNNGQLLAPENLEQPLPLTEVKGNLNWQPTKTGWRVATKDLQWQGPKGLLGRTDFELDLFSGDAQPVINLNTQFSGDSWGAVRTFFPRVPVIDDDAREWIRTAIVDGRVSKGSVQLRGRLDHFPFHNPGEPGLFRIAFDVTEGSIHYAEGWPLIDRINTQVVFQGRAMQIDARSGRILGMPVGPVAVSVKDFYLPLLEVDGKAAGDAGKMLSFLKESPLREDYAALVDALKLQGPAKLDLRLEIPLDQLEATRVAGVVTLDGRTQLTHTKLPEPITAITGQVRFDNNGLTARDLTGDLLGLKLLLQMDPQLQDGQRLIRLQAATQLAFPRDSARLSRLVSADMLAHLHGSSQWQADMLFDASAKPARLRLSSDLLGLWINLPPPFNKDRDQAQQLDVSLDPSSATGMRADIRYGRLLRAALSLQDGQGGWSLDRGHVLFGDGTAQLPAKPGLWLDGRIAELDLAVWQEFQWTKTPATPAAPTPTPKPASPLLLQQVDLRFDRLKYNEQQFDNLRLQLSGEGADWLLAASAPSVEGTVRWPQKAEGRPIYRADFQRLNLRAPEPPASEADSTAAPEDTSPARDPASLPGLSFLTRSLRVNEHELGRLQLEAVPIPNGLALSTLSLDGDLQLQGGGNWTRVGGRSSAQLSLSAKGKRLKQAFAALGYVPSLDAENVRVQASLAWAPNAEGIKTESLGGGFSLDLGNGVLLAVEPGAGRVLGLLNFFVLPRRLTLDFRDVLSKGLVFDTLKGDFRIENGNAWTDNLKIRGPSLQMEIEGRVGLAARDYDQKVTIHPQVSTGVALAGAVAGGPALGLALLVAQQLFKKPLEDISELSYRLRGPWDNPSIERD